MNYCADIFLVHAHSVCTRSAQYGVFRIKEPVFNLRLFLFFKTGVIEARKIISECSTNLAGHTFRPTSRSAENNHRAAFSSGKKKRRIFLGRSFFYIIMNVRPVAVAPHNMRISAEKYVGYTAQNFRRSSSRKRSYYRRSCFFNYFSKF